MTLSTSHSEFASQTSAFPIGKALASPAAGPSLAADGKSERKSLRGLPNLPSTHVWGIDYSIVDMAHTLDFVDTLVLRREPTYAITANVNYAMLCEENPRLAAFTQRSRLVLCDGIPILWRSRLNKLSLPERVAGADFIYRVAERSAERGYRIFMMGGAEGIAQKAADRLLQRYPGLIIAGVECPPFRNPTPDEHAQLCQRIRLAKPDILFVALGQPKGEFWIEENYQSLGVPFSIQLGASFDFVAGHAVRAPRWIQRIGMEWLFRATQDPRRLLPRYAKNAWYLAKAIRGELLTATQ